MSISVSPKTLNKHIFTKPLYHIELVVHNVKLIDTFGRVRMVDSAVLIVLATLFLAFPLATHHQLPPSFCHTIW